MGIFDDMKQVAIRKVMQVGQKVGIDAQTTRTIINEVATKRETFTFERLPESLEELQQLPEAALTSPFQTAALVVCALCAYAASPEIGIEMLNFLKGPQPLSTYDMQFLRDRFNYMNFVPFSFFEGSSPENNYTPSVPYRIKVKSSPNTNLGGDRVTLFLHSSGADSDRPLTLRRKGNQYFLWEQHLLSGIRTPRAHDPWAD